MMRYFGGKQIWSGRSYLLWSIACLAACLLFEAKPPDSPASALYRRQNDGDLSALPRPGLAPPANATQQRAEQGSDTLDLGGRITGGTVTRDDSGIIVVEPNKVISEETTSLTTDAVITSSLIAKISSEPRLRVDQYNVQSNNGIVSIRAQGTSVADAVTVINLALSVDDVKEVIYFMPSAV